MNQVVKKPLTDLRRLLHEQDLRVIITLILFLFVISGAINFQRIAYPTNNDYSLHVLYTQYLIEGDIQRIPLFNLAHPVLQFLLATIHYLSFRKLGLYASLIVVQTVSSIITGLILYFWFGKGQREGWNWIRALWSISLTIIAPVMLLALQDGQFYFGYIGLANYHNPTIHLLRPVALLSFIQAIKVFKRPFGSSAQIAGTAILLVLSVLIKPNFAICILPSIGILAILSLYRNKPVDWRMLVFGFFIPAGVVLFAQWIVGYAMASSETVAILFRPFEVESAFSNNLIAKFILSTLFPLAVITITFRQVFNETDSQLAWMSFIFGAAQMYLLAEGGDRFYHGNFRWGAQISLFLVFVVAARNLFRKFEFEKPFQNPQSSVLYGTYFAHLLAGVVYYVRVFISPNYG